MWIKGLARRRSVAERVGSRRRSQDKRQSVRHRGLRIEQFEERMLLSVAPTTVNDVLINQIGALAPQALTSRAVATDNNGDFVVAWQQYDFNSAGGADSNIYGRYYTNAVQRIDLPAGTQSMALRYNGNAIEELSISAETKPFTAVSDASNDVAGSFQLTYTDPSSNKPYTGTVTGFDEDNNSLTGNAAAISQALGTMASSMTADGITALNGATVQAIDATDYQINFGNASGGNWQPLLTATYDDGSGNSTFTSGFLPAVEVTMVRQPNATVIIPVSSDASVTAANIQYAFSQTSATFDIAPTVFSQTHLAPYGAPATLTTALPSVSVTSRSATEFDVTFTGGAGLADQPLMTVLDPTTYLPMANATVQILKQSSDAFRVNDPEVQDPNVLGSQFYNQSNPQVAMDLDGDFVVTWESVVPDSANHGSVSDIFARRFSPASWVDDAYRDIVFTPTGSSTLSGQFMLTTGNGVTTAITFDSTNLTQTASDLQDALHSLLYDPSTTVSVESNSGQYVLRVTWGGADAGLEPLLEYTPVINPATNQPDLAATVTTESASSSTAPAVAYRDIQVTPTGSSTITGQFTLTTGNGVTKAINFDYANLSQTASDLQSALHVLGYDPLTTVSVESSGAPYVLRVNWGGADVGKNPLLEYNAVINPATNLPYLSATVTISTAVPFIADMDDDGVADTPIQGVRAPSGQFQVNTLTANAQSEPSVGMDSVGNFTIVWASKGQNLSYFNSIEGQRFDRYGNRLGGEVTVDTEATQGTEEPFVAVSHDGAIAVAWSQTIDPNAYLGGISSWSVMAKVFDPQGNVLMNQFSVGGAGGGTIAFDSADNFVVGYDTLTTNDDTSAGAQDDVFAIEYQLYGANGSVSGAVIRPTFRINSASFSPSTTKDFWPNGQYGPQVAMDADGDLTVSYSGFGPDVAQPDVTQGIDDQALIPAAALGMSSADLAAMRLALEGQYVDEYGLVHNTYTDPLGNVDPGGYDLLRGEANGAMYSQFDTDPTIQTPTALSSDDVANNQRDGQDTTYLLDLDPNAVSGSFQVKLTTSAGVNMDNTPLTNSATITITPVYQANNGPVDAAKTAQAIHDALSAASILGINWPQTADNALGYTGTPFEGPVSVRLVPTSEITNRTGTAWDVANGGITPTYDVYEITFLGEVHDSPVTMETVAGSNTMKENAPATDEIQTISVTVPTTKLAAAVAPGDTTITVTAAARFLGGQFQITVGGETMWVTGESGPGNTVWTLGSPATAAHPASATVVLSPASPIDFFMTPNGGGALVDISATLDASLPANFAADLQSGLQLDAGYTGTTVTYQPPAASAPDSETFVYKVDFAGPDADKPQPTIFWDQLGTEVGVHVGVVETVKGSPAVTGGDAPMPNVACEIYGFAGTDQYNTSLAMTSDGSFVEVWNETALTNTGNYSNTNLYFRTFAESTDTAGPQVANWFAPGSTMATGENDPIVDENQQVVTSAGLTHIVLSFDKEMYDNATHTGDAVTNPANYLLLQNGVPVAGNIVGVQYGLNEASILAASDPKDYGDLNVSSSNRWEVVLTIDASGALGGKLPLRDGSYTIEALAPVAATANTLATSGLRDKAGTALGRTGYVPNGQNYTRDFTVVTSKGEIDGTVSNKANGQGLAGWTVFADLPAFGYPQGNGVPDPGEISTTTAGDGSYKLVGLPAGVTYYIREVLPSNWTEVTPAIPVNFYSVPVANSIPITGDNFVNLYADALSPAVTVNAQVTNYANWPSTPLTLTGTVTDPPPSSGISKVTVVVGGQTLAATVNGTAWTATVPTKLSDGTYDVQVTATDVAGNIGYGQAIGGLIVDTVKPTVTVDTQSWTNDPMPTLTGTVNDVGPSSGISGVMVAVINSSGVQVQTLTALINPVTHTWRAPVPIALSDGSYDVTATALDNALNTSAVFKASRAVSVDTVNPTVTVDPKTANSKKPILTGTVNDAAPSSGISEVTVVVGTQMLTAVVTNTTWMLDMSLVQPDGTYPQALANGTYNVTVTATDNAGNSGSNIAANASNALTINTVTPSVTVDTLPPTKNPAPTVTGTVTDGSSGVTVNVFDATDTLVQGPLPATVNGTKWSTPLASLVDGAYTITATSSKGFTAYNKLIVDAQSPTVTVDALPPTSNATPTLTGTVSDPAPSGGIAGVTVVIGTQTLTATLSSSPVAQTSTMWTWTWSAVLPTVLAGGDGTYNVQATATDKAGNISNIATSALTLDTGKPTVSIDGQVATSSTPTLTGTVTDPAPSSGISTVTVAVGTQRLWATFSPVVGTPGKWTWSAVVTTPLTDNMSYDVMATATDNAGNSGSDATTIELITDPADPATATPQVSIDPTTNQLTIVPAVQNFSTVGLYNPSTSVFSLKNSDAAGNPDVTFNYGPANGGWIPIAGDWDGNGTDTLGLYNPTTSVFYLRNTTSLQGAGDLGYADVAFTFGQAGAGWIPIAGDWNGDGKDTIGLYDPTKSVFYLRNTTSLQGPSDLGYADVAFAYGAAGAGWIPIAGDWDGDGKDTVGLYDPATSKFYLRNTTSLQGPSDLGYADVAFAYGAAGAGWTPIAGDWDGDGKDTIGLYNPATSKFYLRNTTSLQGLTDLGYADVAFTFGTAGAGGLPIAGNWTGPVNACLAAGGAVAASASVPTLTQADLRPIISEAIARWTSAGLDAADVAKLTQAQFVVGDLPGSYLGETEGGAIYIDGNAAGHGWFVDPTPALDEEFTSSPSNQQLRAIDPRAVDRIDLLTVVEHELGHIVGLGDLDASASDLMSGLLGTGVRRNASRVDAILASEMSVS